MLRIFCYNEYVFLVSNFIHAAPATPSYLSKKYFPSGNCRCLKREYENSLNLILLNLNLSHQTRRITNPLNYELVKQTNALNERTCRATPEPSRDKVKLG